MDKAKTILLIDDDTSLLVTLGDFLKFEGYNVVTADTGESGLRHLKRMSPDLIILDMSMPGMGGLGFLKEISPEGARPKFPVLVLTARANMADFFSDVDVAGFISKPCDPDVLLSEVSRIILMRSSQKKELSEDSDDRKKILLAEDDGGLANRIKEAFVENSYIIIMVNKGPEAIEKAVVERPDLILIKRVLEGMNGDTVSRMLQQMPNTRNLPVVLYDDSGENLPGSRFLNRDSGIKEYISSSDPVELLKVVEETLRIRVK